MKSFLLTRLLPALVLAMAFSEIVLAQPGSGGPAPGATVTPIDGGISLLLAGGVAYGIKQLRRRKQ